MWISSDKRIIFYGFIQTREIILMELYRQGRSLLWIYTDKGDHSQIYRQGRPFLWICSDKGDHSYGCVQTRDIIIMALYRPGRSFLWMYTDKEDHSSKDSM